MVKKGAIYLRLSRDDSIGTESESITSQRLFLLQYAERNHIEIGYEFADDGISGTNFQRRALKNLLHAIESGCIDTVLVKDLSRLSRDYIRTGELLEKWFPEHGVRLIAVSDGVDTGVQSASNDFFPIRAVMDDWYARDISRKVRSALYARQRAGICTAANLPYGYERAGDTVRPCIQNAETVRAIYQAYTDGASCCAIAAALNAANTAPVSKSASGWNDVTVRRILCNPAYIGQLMLHKTEKRSYKSVQKRYLPASEHIVYRVPPLISDAMFMQAQQRMKASAHKAKPKDWLSGIVACAVCGGRMYSIGSGTSARLICSSRKRRKLCTNPSLKRDTLIQMIHSALNADGISVSHDALPALIRHIAVSQETVLFRMKYKNPHTKEQSSARLLGKDDRLPQ